MFLKKKIEYYLFFLFFLLLGISLLLFKDYGISIDEESTRFHGIVTYNYILIILNNYFVFILPLEIDSPDLENYEFRSYGVLFEVFRYSWKRFFLLLIIKIFFILDIF